MKIFKFYSEEKYYAYSGNSEDEAKELLFEEVGEMPIDKVELIPESEWDVKNINVWEDNDFEKMQTLITEDYILYEDGLIWNNDSLIKGLKGYLTAFPGATFDYRLSNFKTTVGMNVATTYYQNEGKMITPDSTFQFNWIESAFFVKEENEWKISFLHSTVKKGR